MNNLFSILIVFIIFDSCKFPQNNLVVPEKTAKKVIGVGHEFCRMTPADLQENIDSLDKLPFDGLKLVKPLLQKI